MSGEQRSKMLSPATYWLLVVLLAHAEELGIVRGMSYGQLQAVTGMSRERLKSQLAKLKKLGLIARHHPGILSKGGARMRSVYVLNLAHPLLWGEDSTGLTVVYELEPGRANLVSGFYQAATVASELIENSARIAEMAGEAGTLDEEKVNSKTSLKNPSFRERIWDAYYDLLDSAKSLLPSMRFIVPAVISINKMHRLGMSQIIEVHIQAYAMMLLSKHWKDLENERGGAWEPIGAVMTAIEKDCIALQGYADREVEPNQNSALLICIYTLSHHLAIQLQSDLKYIETLRGDGDFSTAAFSMQFFSCQKTESWRLKAHYPPSEGIVCLGNVVLLTTGVSLTFPECLAPVKRVRRL